PTASEPIAQSRRRDDAGGQRQEVGIDNPLQGGQAASNLTMDGREGGDHYQDVQRRHEEGGGGQRQGPAGPRSLNCHRDGSSLRNRAAGPRGTSLTARLTCPTVGRARYGQLSEIYGAVRVSP